MAIPTDSVYPTSLDSITTLGGDLVNQMALTLDGAINDVVTSLVVNESISNITVPCIFIFADNAEIIFCEAKDDSTKTFSSITRGVLGGASAASHSDGASIKMDVVNWHLYMLKKAIIATQTELGTDPANEYANVATAIAALAKEDLSNLASTAVNASISPASDETINLGETNKRFANILGTYLIMKEKAAASGNRAAGESELWVNTSHKPQLTTTYGTSDFVSKQFWLLLEMAVDPITIPVAPYGEISTGSFYLPMLYYDATQTEGNVWAFIMPANYAGGEIYVDIYYHMENDNSSKACKWSGEIAAISNTDLTAESKSFDTQNVSTVTCPDALGTTDIATIIMTNKDSVVVGDLVYLQILRLGADAADTAAGDALITGILIRYN